MADSERRQGLDRESQPVAGPAAHIPGAAHREALVITGPTAAGKTALSIAMAERLQGEIISMDSRQVYRGMDIGTAKATPEEQARIPHHGLDLVNPGQRYSAGRFASDARRWIHEIRARGHVPLLVGGTGFFLHALIRPLFAEPQLDPMRRAQLAEYLSSQPPERLRSWLAHIDPESAAALEERGGRQRIVRALEIALLTGRPLSWWHRNAPAPAPPLRPLVFVVNLPRTELDHRIDERVMAMLDAGLVAEVEKLLGEGYRAGDPGMNATGYPEIIAFLQGELSLDEAATAIQRATRRYARRQLTWFRNQIPDAIWLDASQPLTDLVETIAQTWAEEAL
jgi:tRNA dimethylallyltransferase